MEKWTTNFYFKKLTKRKEKMHTKVVLYGVREVSPFRIAKIAWSIDRAFLKFEEMNRDSQGVLIGLVSPIKETWTWDHPDRSMLIKNIVLTKGGIRFKRGVRKTVQNIEFVQILHIYITLEKQKNLLFDYAFFLNLFQRNLRELLFIACKIKYLENWMSQKLW